MKNKIYIAIYIASLVIANLLVAWFGPWFSPVNALLLIGLDLSLRDKLHDAWQGNGLHWRIGSLIVASGAISYVLNPAAGMIAISSVVAFCAAMAADSIVYQALRRFGWFTRVNGSNVAGASVDSVVFPTIAFGSFMPEIVAMQFAAKVAGGAIWSFILRK
jgi:hypothetical protein